MHSFFFAKLGYSVILFEVSQRKYYILQKNNWINNFTNVLLTNRGLYNEEKTCDYFTAISNAGN